MRFPVWSAMAAVLTLATSPARAATITLNFDSVALAPATCTDATAYLASFGITLSPVTLGTTSRICSAVGTTNTTTSPPNLWDAQPPVGNTDFAYDLLFATPMSDFSFTRGAAQSQNTMTAWTMTAFDAASVALDSVSQPFFAPGPTTTAAFTLTGPGIVRLRIEAFNSIQSTFNHPPFDDFRFTVTDVPTAVPEPASLLLLGTGIAGAALRRRRSRKRG